MSSSTPSAVRSAPAVVAPASPIDQDEFEQSRELLWEIRQASQASADADLDDLANTLLPLLDLLQQWQNDPQQRQHDVQQLSGFIASGMEAVRSAANDPSSSRQVLRKLARQGRDGWSDALALTADPGFAADCLRGWNDRDEAVDRVEPAVADDLQAPSDAEISRILAELTETPTTAAVGKQPADPRGSHAPSPDDDGEMNDELREAFLDDASRCIGAMEEALLSYEANPKDRRPLQQICRELHTLKGASGSVGLTDLADYLHGIEDRLRDSSESTGNTPSVESLFQNLDAVRQRVSRVRQPSPSTAGEAAVTLEAAQTAVGATGAMPLNAFASYDEASGDEESLRVKPAQLNRLMDMLAELIMLRNRRDCELSELKEIHRELLHSVSRLRVFSDRCDGLDASMAAAERRPADDHRPLPRLSEVAGDVMEAAQRLRDAYQPVAEGNVAVSQFIRQFRQELVSLRRMPVAGLFRRLQRVASDAARAEGKQVRLVLLGEDAGIERSLQQRLYEPLLHIIRNAVSHGIEPPELRTRQEKPPVGRITLEARTGPDLLVIEIRDDGRGLDYDALRRRGLELGLLTAHAAAHHQELSQLIFHPGFSTRQAASQVAGRGVGMDVVASTIHRMRGWVEVDSVTGEGTTFRLTFPLPSVIQHTMAFRSAGQTFALPMQFVQAAGDVDADLPTLRLSDWIGPDEADPNAPAQSLVVGSERSTSDAPQASGRRFRLLIDQILGPEEVVVRPLPALLKHHPFCSGATLSGTGDVVLVLDNHRFVEWAAALANDPHDRTRAETPLRHPPSEPPRPRVLVVDDSLSARKRVVRCLRAWNIETVEAADGEEACQILKKETFAAVFSDLEMPQLDGLELLSEIRAERFGEPVPLVIISSRTDQAVQDRALALGVSGYLSKPVSEASLLGVIRDIPSLCGALPSPHIQLEPTSRGDRE